MLRGPLYGEGGESQKCEAVPRRACVQGSKTCVSLNSRLENKKEERRREGGKKTFEMRGEDFLSAVNLLSGFEFWVSGFGFQILGLGFGVSGFGFRASCFGSRVSNFGFRVSDFGFRVSDFGRRVSGFGV